MYILHWLADWTILAMCVSNFRLNIEHIIIYLNWKTKIPFPSLSCIFPNPKQGNLTSEIRFCFRLSLLSSSSPSKSSCTIRLKCIIIIVLWRKKCRNFNVNIVQKNLRKLDLINQHKQMTVKKQERPQEKNKTKH